MSAIATPRDRSASMLRPELKLLHGAEEASTHDRAACGAELRLVEQCPRVLVAGANPGLRAAVRRELAGAMAPDTPFGEAGKVWEVLEQAPGSAVVMLAGDLEDASSDTLIKLLAQRHHWLPVIALDVCEGDPERGAAADSGVSTAVSESSPTTLGTLHPRPSVAVRRRV
jgi:hypothetical protein